MRKTMPFILAIGVSTLYGTTGIINKDAKIREFPSMKAKTVATRKKGRELEILQKVDGGKDGYFYQTPKGYIYETFITLETIPTTPKLPENSKVDVNHPYGNPMYVDASKIENKPTVLTDEKGQVYTKSVFPPVALVPTTTVTPIEKEVVVQGETTQGALVEEKVVQEVVVAPIPMVAVVPVVQEEQKEELKEVVKKEEVVIITTPTRANFDYAASFIGEPEPTEELKVEEQPVIQEQIAQIESPKEEPTQPAPSSQNTQKYFAGIGFGLNSLAVKKQDQVGSIILNHTPDEKATSFTFLGGINLTNGRVYGNYEILNLDDVEINSYYLLYDYIFPYFLSPYLGVSLGMADLKWQIDPLVNSQTKDDKLSSLLYGIQGGIEYPIENQLNIYSQISYQKLDFTTNLISTPAKSTVTHENKKSFVMGLKYSF